MTVQLIIAGYLLTYIFEINSLMLIVIIFLVMSLFAAHIILQKSGVNNNRLLPFIMLSIFLINFLITSLFLLLISRVTPWYEARYFIPIAGMILGNSMNSSALTLDSVFNDFKENRKLIETYLTFGASPLEALKPSFNKAIRTALLPTLTSMTGIGIVFLPGMMTGQILSGVNPLIAVKYQIAIMIAIISSVTFTSISLLALTYRLKFNKAHQILEI